MIFDLSPLLLCAIIFILNRRNAMNKHCKECKYHHDANHPKTSNLGSRYNDWCVKFSNTARDVIGHCKLKQGKVLK